MLLKVTPRTEGAYSAPQTPAGFRAPLRSWEGKEREEERREWGKRKKGERPPFLQFNHLGRWFLLWSGCGFDADIGCSRCCRWWRRSANWQRTVSSTWRLVTAASVRCSPSTTICAPLPFRYNTKLILYNFLFIKYSLNTTWLQVVPLQLNAIQFISVQFNSNLAAREPDSKWYAVEIIDKNITRNKQCAHMYIGAGRDLWSGLGVTMLVGNGVGQSVWVNSTFWCVDWVLARKWWVLA